MAGPTGRPLSSRDANREYNTVIVGGDIANVGLHQLVGEIAAWIIWSECNTTGLNRHIGCEGWRWHRRTPIRFSIAPGNTILQCHR